MWWVILRNNQIGYVIVSNNYEYSLLLPTAVQRLFRLPYPSQRPAFSSAMDQGNLENGDWRREEWRVYLFPLLWGKSRKTSGPFLHVLAHSTGAQTCM